MKLKTLKDLGYGKHITGGIRMDECGCMGCSEGVGCDIEIIRKEAIKWANDKESYEKFNHTKSYWRWVFMKFHNITDEDLK